MGKLVLKLNKKDARLNNYGGFIMKTPFKEGGIGTVNLSAVCVRKIRQIFKQLLVASIDGAKFTAEFPGMEFRPFPGVEFSSMASRNDTTGELGAVGWVELRIWNRGVELIIQDTYGDSSYVWDVTEALSEELDKVQNNFDDEQAKRKAWFEDRAAGKPLVGVSGKKRGRHKKQATAPE